MDISNELKRVYNKGSPISCAPNQPYTNATQYLTVRTNM